MRMIFLARSRARRRLETIRERFTRRVDEVDDKFLRKLLLNAGNCASIDALELTSGIARREGGEAFGVVERCFAALAFHHARKFCFEHIERINAKEAALAINRVFGEVGALDIDFGASLCVENLGDKTRAYIDEFLKSSYNGFVETLECLVPLDSISLMGAV